MSEIDNAMRVEEDIMDHVRTMHPEVYLGPLEIEAPRCDRCGRPADANRIDVSTHAQPASFVWGHIACTTPGCVDETGSARVDPPDVPGELTREDRKWLRRQRAVAQDYAAVSLRLVREVL